VHAVIVCCLFLFISFCSSLNDFRLHQHLNNKQISLTPWRLGGFGDFRKKNQQFLVALPTP